VRAVPQQPLAIRGDDVEDVALETSVERGLDETPLTLPSPRIAGRGWPEAG